MVTSTVQHDASHTLSESLVAVTAAWSAAFSGRDAQLVRKPEKGTEGPPLRQYIGQVRSLDFTSGANGWHPHIHAVVVFDALTPEVDRLNWLQRRRDAYLYALARLGRRAAPDKRGWHVSPIRSAADTANYLAKVDGGWGAGLELMRADLKRGRLGGLTPWQILERAVGFLDEITNAEVVKCIRLWDEYELATKGRRCVIVGRELARRYRATALAEESDEDAAAADLDAAVVYTVLYTPSEWAEIVTEGRGAFAIERAVADAIRYGFLAPPDD